MFSAGIFVNPESIYQSNSSILCHYVITVPDIWTVIRLCSSVRPFLSSFKLPNCCLRCVYLCLNVACCTAIPAGGLVMFLVDCCLWCEAHLHHKWSYPLSLNVTVGFSKGCIVFFISMHFVAKRLPLFAFARGDLTWHRFLGVTAAQYYSVLFKTFKSLV